MYSFHRFVVNKACCFILAFFSFLLLITKVLIRDTLEVKAETELDYKSVSTNTVLCDGVRSVSLVFQVGMGLC